MPNRAPISRSCTDPIVGAILSGWRYDISNVSPEMRTDYESHLNECEHCRHRQHLARTIDFLLITVSTLSIAAFLLMAVVLHRLELAASHFESVHHLEHFANGVTLHLGRTPVAISLEAVAIAGLIVSMVLWILVAIATPLPGIIGSMVRQRVPEVRERLARRHAA